MRFAKLSSTIFLSAAFAGACSSPSGVQQQPDLAGFGGPMVDMSGTSNDLAGGGPDLANPLIHEDLAGADLSTAPGSNQVPLVVDGYEMVPDVSYISVTLCVPGTTTCQTIDHIDVDTGSVGLRIISGALNSTMLSALPHAQVGGKSLSECYIYGDGFVYGSVRTGDVSIGGEKATGTNFHVLGDLTSIPSDCEQNGGGAQGDESTLQAFGSNGIIGLQPESPDCGTNCASAGNQPNPFYYSYTGTGTATSAGVASGTQVPNTYTVFPTDNNGVILDLPAVDDNAGAGTTTGTITFGIGTQPNNAVTATNILGATGGTGLESLSAKISTTSFQLMVFDSGTSTLSFNLSSLTQCSGQEQGWYCPTALTSETASLTGTNATASFPFKVGNTDTLFNNQSSVAFDDLASTGQSGFLILGLPAFFGHKMFIGMSGGTGVTGPFYAF